MATRADPGDHRFVVSLIYIVALLQGAQIGQNTKFLVTLINKKRPPVKVVTTLGAVSATSIRIDDQAITGMKRVIHVDAIPYQDRG